MHNWVILKIHSKAFHYFFLVSFQWAKLCWQYFSTQAATATQPPPSTQVLRLCLSHRAHGAVCQQQLPPHTFLAPSLHFQQLEIVTNTFKCSHDVSFSYRQLLSLAQGCTLQWIEKAVTIHSQIVVLMVYKSSVEKKKKEKKESLTINAKDPWYKDIIISWQCLILSFQVTGSYQCKYPLGFWMSDTRNKGSRFINSHVNNAFNLLYSFHN